MRVHVRIDGFLLPRALVCCARFSAFASSAPCAVVAQRDPARGRFDRCAAGPRGVRDRCGGLSCEFAEDGGLGSASHPGEGDRVPYEGGAAVAQDDFVAGGGVEELCKAFADAADQGFDRRLPVRRPDETLGAAEGSGQSGSRA